MKRRTRLIAGIFALVAITFSFAETAWASTCAPAMEMAAASSASAEDMPAQDCMHGAAHSGDGETDGQDERPCPFTPTAGQTCTAVATLPAHVADAFAPPVEGATVAWVEPAEHNTLLDNTLFRPPRA